MEISQPFCAAYALSLALYRSTSQCSERISCVAVCVHCLMPWHWSSLKWDTIHSLCTLPSGIMYTDKVFLGPSHFQAEETQPSQPLVIEAVLWFLHLLMTFFGLPPVCPCPSCSEKPRNRHHTPCGFIIIEYMGRVIFLYLLATLCLMQSKTHLAVSAASARCWFIFNLAFTWIPRSFFAEQLSSCVVLSMFWCLRLFLPSHRTWHIPLLKSMLFLSARFSSLWRFLWIEAQSSATLATSFSYASPANTLGVHSAPSSRSLTKTLNSTGPNTNLWVTAFHPLGSAIQRVFGLPHCPSNPHFISFLMSILWETVLEVLSLLILSADLHFFYHFLLLLIYFLLLFDASNKLIQTFNRWK